MSNGDVLVLDIVNRRWSITSTSTGATIEVAMVDGPEIWDFLVGPDDVIYVVTSSGINAVALEDGQLVAAAASADARPPIAGNPPMGGRLTAGVNGVRVLGEWATELGYVDRSGASLPALSRFAVLSDVPFVIDSSIGRISVSGRGLLAPYVAELSGATVFLAAFAQQDSSGAANVGFAIADGSLVDGVRLPDVAGVLDGIGTDVRLHDGSVYRLERRGTDLADGFAVVSYPVDST